MPQRHLSARLKPSFCWVVAGGRASHAQRANFALPLLSLSLLSLTLTPHCVMNDSVPPRQMGIEAKSIFLKCWPISLNAGQVGPSFSALYPVSL